MTLRSINPTTGVEIGRFAADSPDEVERKIAAAVKVFSGWKHVGFQERCSLMREAGARIRLGRDSLAQVLSEEMGKPIVQAEREVDRFAGRCDYFADNAQKMLEPEHVSGTGVESWIRFEPLGVALGVMPWNFPYGQASRWLIPALMSGNTALLKHASNVTLAARAIADVFTAAGFPPGVFDVLLLPSSQLVGVLQDPRIASVSLTGSTAAGVAVASAAGQTLKKLVMELGGSDPFIVLEDADVATAAEAAARSRFQNAGQACTAAKRFIPVERVADAFTEAFIAETRKLIVGDPLNRATDIGPLAKSDVLEDLIRQQQATLAQGARTAYQTAVESSGGYFFPPTILVDVTPEMIAAQEETFGPLAPILRVRDAHAAIEVANQSQYGLGASIWTADTDRAVDLAGRLDVGMVAINGTVLADPRLPFGGVKQSGFGREMSTHGIRELTNIQTMSVNSSTAPKYSR